MATAQDLIDAALTEIGVRAAGETLDAASSADALARLNRYLDRLAAENLSVYQITRTVGTLTANQATFSVGPGGNINIARPVFIERVSFLNTNVTPNIEYPLGDLMTEAEYARWPLKTLTAPFPYRAYYSPTYPTGTLQPFPIPTSAGLSWVIYAWTALTQIAALTDTVALPPAYAEMIVQNLALLLCPSYERQPHPILVRSAAESLATVKRANGRVLELSFGADIGAARGGYSIYTDTVV